MTLNRRKTPVIIDTDPGVDDVLAILLALASPELEILAIIVSFGNTDVHAACANVYKLYQAVGRHITAHPEDSERFPNYTPIVPPVLVLGPHGPLQGGLHYAQKFHGKDGLGNITERHPDLSVSFSDKHKHFQSNFTAITKSAIDVVLDLLESRPERSITYIVLGPPTNLAMLNREHHQTIRTRIGRVVMMGGALDVPGNKRPVAEFNFFADPFAAKDLLCPVAPGTGLPLERVLLATLDVTTRHELPFPFYIQHIDPTFDSTRRPSIGSAKAPLIHFTSAFLERAREMMISFGKDALELHDVVAVWCAIENPPEVVAEENALPGLSPGWAAVKRKFDIERMGEITRGMLVVDRREDQTAYAPGANRSEVQALLKQSHQRHGLLESTAVPAPVEMESDGLRKGPDEWLGHPTVHDDSLGGSMDVACIVGTPGKDALLQLLTERLWGANCVDMCKRHD
ncbi:Inosine/uridine-preferring nucleoside hydrolase domain containing protein [Tylopilus felleus]